MGQDVRVSSPRYYGLEYTQGRIKEQGTCPAFFCLFLSVDRTDCHQTRFRWGTSNVPIIDVYG